MRIKPIIVCQTKVDLEFEGKNQWNQIDKEIIKISSLTGKGLNKLVKKLYQSFIKKIIK